jgi:hypothetical protein
MEIRDRGRLMARVRRAGGQEPGPAVVGWEVVWSVEAPRGWRPQMYASRAEAVQAVLWFLPHGTVHPVAWGRLA